MLSDEQVEKIVERLLQRVEKANTYFLKQLGAKVKKIKALTPSEAHKLVQILKYGGEYNDIVKQISKYTDIDIKEIDKIFKEFSKKDQSFAKGFYQYRNKPYIPYEQNEVLKRQTEALARIVKNEMYDYTRSKVLGYSIRDEKGIMRFSGLKETYNRVLDEALLNISQGKESFDMSMSRIMKEIGGNGLKTIDYASGRSVRLDSVLRMHTQSSLRELHNENQALFGKEFDSDGVEISVHANPAPDHEEVQGRQFSNEEYEKLQSGVDAVDYKGKTYNLDHDAKNGYRPISELNCYHYTFAIILGINEPEYTDRELRNIINEGHRKVIIDGKKYTKYECTQLQRQLETRIREQKDIQTLAKASGNEFLAGEAQNKITVLTRKYNEVSQASGLPTKANRLKVVNYKRSASATSTYQNEINKFKVGEFDITKYTGKLKPTTNDVIFTPKQKAKNDEKHFKDRIYYDKILDIMNNPDQVYLEAKKPNTVWLVKEYDGQKVLTTIKINTTTLYQQKELGYKNSIIHIHRTRENYVINKKNKKELELLFDIKKKK